MSKIFWLTDIHIDCLFNNDATPFGEYLKREIPGLSDILITGDISNSRDVISNLKQLRNSTKANIYFVLGNHDYEGSGFEKLDKVMSNLSISGVTWLDKSNPIHFDGCSLIGSGGWYDAYHGDAYGGFIMGEWNRIDELIPGTFYMPLLVDAARKRAESQGKKLLKKLNLASKVTDNIIIATHVPPFKESAFHLGKPSDQISLPWFTNMTFGAILSHFARFNPKINLTVLCGHTHDLAFYQPHPNLTVHTGHSQYGNPRISGYINKTNGNITLSQS